MPAEAVGLYCVRAFLDAPGAQDDDQPGGRCVVEPDLVRRETLEAATA